MMNRTIVLGICALLFFTEVNGQNADTSSQNNKMLSVVWQQQSAEFRALCYQAFNLAQLRLEEKKIRKRHRYAIVTDIDETVLDNSYQEADNILAGKEYSKDTWKAWTDKAKATPIPGALKFFRYAKKRGVAIFYISNRDTAEVSSTMKNLQAFGFPDADKQHLLFYSNTSSKESRRQQVMKDYRIIMLLGDNLNDFTSAFEKKPNQERLAETDKVKDEWGRKFIVLPNSTYGDWENAAYDYQRNLTPQEKTQKLRSKLIGSGQ